MTPSNHNYIIFFNYLNHIMPREPQGGNDT
jgi:hypothetical protein